MGSALLTRVQGEPAQGSVPVQEAETSASLETGVTASALL